MSQTATIEVEHPYTAAYCQEVRAAVQGSKVDQDRSESTLDLQDTTPTSSSQTFTWIISNNCQFHVIKDTENDLDWSSEFEVPQRTRPERLSASPAGHICSIGSKALLLDCEGGEQASLTVLEKTAFLTLLPMWVTDRRCHTWTWGNYPHVGFWARAHIWWHLSKWAQEVKNQAVMKLIFCSSSTMETGFAPQSLSGVKRFIPWMEWHSAGSRVGRTLLRRRLGSAELP